MYCRRNIKVHTFTMFLFAPMSPASFIHSSPSYFHWLTLYEGYLKIEMINSRLMLTHRLDSDSTVVYYLALNSLSSKSLLLFIVFHVQFTLCQGPLQTWPFPFSDYINEFHLKHFLIGCCIRTQPPHAVTCWTLQYSIKVIGEKAC